MTEEKWAVIKPYLKGSTLLDLGSWDGTLCVWAAAEVPAVRGVDNNPPETLQWPVEKLDMLTLSDAALQVDNAVMISVWPYIVRDYGEACAREFLSRVIRNAKQLFFETQLHGDGPGPEALCCLCAVEALLRDCGGAPVLLANLAVGGRNAYRAIYKVVRA